MFCRRVGYNEDGRQLIRGRKPSKPYTYERSWNYVLWLLSRKAYTKKQLRDKLVRRAAEAEVIERVLDKLEERRFVDDETYADMYVRSRQKRKGRVALRRELFHKGVSEEIVDKTLEPLTEEDQIAAASAVLSKNAWRFTRDDARKTYAKAYAFLARRGFTSDVVKAALEEVALGEED